jgi:hypothetical protein
MGTTENTNPEKTNNFRAFAGMLMLLAGGILFLDRFLKTGWLSLLVLPTVGIFLYLQGIRRRHTGMILAGGLIASIGIGCIAAWGPALQLDLAGKIGVNIITRPPLTQLGYIAVITGLGWGMVLVTITLMKLPPVWWALAPAGILVAMGYCLLSSPLPWNAYVFYMSLGIGLPLLIWGIILRLFGLIISGCLIIGAGIGSYLAWLVPSNVNGLTQTGMMLFGFSFGWIAISIVTHQVIHKTVWWPLIPGGIVMMVGMGLYIGGDPIHALGIISNTGSIALMIFGLYLLLMRKGIHH